MTEPNALPDDVALVRTTDVFDEDTMPAGFRRAHRIAAGVWGRLVVHDGSLELVFEDAPDEVHAVEAGGSAVIPPERAHHVRPVGPVRFAVEFHRGS